MSAIARHLGRDRKTVRAYIRGEGQPGQRQKPQDAGPAPFDHFHEYVLIRLVDDPHVWATALYDEVGALGYPSSYISFAREIRRRRLRPPCQACAGLRGQPPTIEIAHPPAEEIQWDWLEFERTPWGERGICSTGPCPSPARQGGCFADREEQPHLIEAIDGVPRRLGGSARRWRRKRWPRRSRGSASGWPWSTPGHRATGAAPKSSPRWSTRPGWRCVTAPSGGAGSWPTCCADAGPDADRRLRGLARSEAVWVPRQD